MTVHIKTTLHLQSWAATLKSIILKTKVIWEAMENCSKTAVLQRCYLSCEERDCVCVCVCGDLTGQCSDCLFVLGGELEGVCV